MTASEELVLLKVKEWRAFEGEAFRVLEFEPSSIPRGGDVLGQKPYASVLLETGKVRRKKIRGYITSKRDFLNLWMIFEERGVREGEEVIIFWTEKNYKLQPLFKFPSSAYPKLVVNVHHEGYLEFIYGGRKPEGKSCEEMGMSILCLKPDVME